MAEEAREEELLVIWDETMRTADRWPASSRDMVKAGVVAVHAAGVAEGIRQAREAVELLYKASATDYALVGAGIQQSLDAIDALESEK